MHPTRIELRKFGLINIQLLIVFTSFHKLAGDCTLSGRSKVLVDDCCPQNLAKRKENPKYRLLPIVKETVMSRDAFS